MKKILFVLTCTLIAFTQNISAQSLFGKLFVLSNGDQFGLVREMMFYADGTYLSITATVRNNNFIF